MRTVKETPEDSIRYHCDDNGLVIAESDATDTVTAQNIWGHRALARKVNGTYYYYVYNGHGDVIQVIDEAGNTVNSYEYDEWGNILSQQETIDNPLKYCGEYYDDESGLYYLRARYYDPKVGRFVSKDSYEGTISNPLSLNLYVYCENDPIGYVDFSGNNPAAVIYMYCMAVASSPDTQLDMQLVAMDLSQGNYFAATFDSAGALIPGATGLGKVADDTASAVLRFFGKKSATEIEAIRQTFGNGQVAMSYKYLKQLVKGSGLETHHLIEKRFADTLGIEADDILSIAIDKNTHQQITNLFRDKIMYNSAFDFLHPERLTTSRATDQQIWDATREVYTEMGMSQCLNPIKESLINAGKNLDWGE